ncbi:hypothetical protein CCACVL1_29362, partial [Corchorus capsularis]
MAWLVLEEVPLQLCHDSFFMEIGNLWGSFITLDESTHCKSRFDLARILISVKRSAKLPAKIVASHNNRKFEFSISVEVDKDFISMNFDRRLLATGNRNSGEGSSFSDDSSNFELAVEKDACMVDMVDGHVNGDLGNCSTFREEALMDECFIGRGTLNYQETCEDNSLEEDGVLNKAKDIGTSSIHGGDILM